VLLLGSFPSEESLRRGEYYANPRNQAWRLLGALCGAHPELPYRERLDVLVRSGIALWDVLEACERQGSLDAAIRKGSERPNDIAGFLERHPSVRVIGLNGRTAQATLARHFASLAEPRVRLVSLPSSSSAHAALSLDAKLRAWSALI